MHLAPHDDGIDTFNITRVPTIEKTCPTHVKGLHRLDFGDFVQNVSRGLVELDRASSVRFMRFLKEAPMTQQTGRSRARQARERVPRVACSAYWYDRQGVTLMKELMHALVWATILHTISGSMASVTYSNRRPVSKQNLFTKSPNSNRRQKWEIGYTKELELGKIIRNWVNYMQLKRGKMKNSNTRNSRDRRPPNSRKGVVPEGGT